MTDLDFAQILRTPVARHGLEPSPLLLALNGHTVRVRGYRVAQEAPPEGWFWLTPQAMRMSEHADGEANDLPPHALRVVLGPAAPERLPQPAGGLLELVGTLQWGRQELPDGSVSWLRLQIDPPHASP